MFRLSIVLCCFLILGIAPQSVRAQSSLDLRGDVGGSGIPGGSIIPGYDNAECDGTIEGAIRYNSGTSCAEFCDGSSWTCPDSSGGLSGPVDCPNIGDECTAQGNIIFAGYHPITQDHLFIPPDDESVRLDYRASGSSSDGTASIDDGFANTNAVPNSTNYPAFKACKDLGFGSHNDWYLPSQVELYYLWAVHEIIEAGGNITNFLSTGYWSSTESSTYTAWYQSFYNGTQDFGPKVDDYRVWCVRR